MRVEHGLLENHADPPVLRWRSGHVGPMQEYRPVIEVLQAADAPQQGGLAAPRRPEYRHYLTGTQVDREVLEEGLVEALCESLAGQHQNMPPACHF